MSGLNRVDVRDAHAGVQEFPGTRRQRFQGLMVIEYEYDSLKLVKEVGQCCAFVETTAKTLVE